jgi:5-formyltetrahydrofolate cyclo-ligase
MPKDKADSSGPPAVHDDGQDGHKKDALRADLRQRRRGLSAAEQQSAANAAAAFVTQLPNWRAARNVALYLAADGELDPAPIATRARQDGKSLFLPVITTRKTLCFHPWPQGAPMATNQFGIPEPTGGEATPVRDLDIIFLPLVGWDPRGGRLGMGGGFYDRSLGGIEGPTLVGLAHECQRVTVIPMQDWDVRLDFIATGHALHACSNDT